MVNYIQSKYDEMKIYAEKNVIQHGHVYMWYLSMITLGLLVYVIYSYVDNGVVHINIVYIAATLLSANAYIINTIDAHASNDTKENKTEE